MNKFLWFEVSFHLYDNLINFRDSKWSEYVVRKSLISVCGDWIFQKCGSALIFVSLLIAIMI